MSLETFKKQVLLLHSEQRTLDSLSTGFSDRYTVHCATSGSEALNTLGETQIDVIVTAQELPGMSGLDALREAKKRSPGTIGILLAGTGNDDLEALVGDQEVFQVVRGNVTAESLRSMIDNATQQARLMALAESANDTTAAVDEPVTEHIVMETSENGSSIISDGTGRLPVLNPNKISPSANVGSSSIDVLVVTKDEEFLVTVKESARGMHNVVYANTLAQADEAVRNHKVGVAVVDAAMLGENVEKMTVHLRAAAPRLVAIVAGRRDDGEMLMDLINRGKVYRFLLKPVSPGRARLAIEASVKHHLEAPDSAFRTTGGAAPAKPAAKPKPTKPAPAKAPKQAQVQAPAPPKAKPKAKPKAQPKPKPAKQKTAPPVQKPQQEPAVAPITATRAADDSQILPSIRVEPRPVPTAAANDASSPIDAGLSDAFGGDDSSFTETVTGLFKTVSKSFTSEKSAKPQPSLTPANDDSGGIEFLQPRFIGIGAAAVVVLAVLAWWLFSGPDEPELTEEPVAATPTIGEEEPPAVGEPPVTEADPVFEAPIPEPGPAGGNIDALLEEARLAAAAGQVFNPPGSNAIELYLAAVEAAPANVEAAAELAAVIDRALAMAENSLLERRASDVEAALNRVGLADPGNARLPFLNAQLSQLQLRNYLDDARASIRASRFEDAAATLDAARALGVADRAEINAVADELSRALSDHRVDDVLAKANARLESGQLTAPSNDNARYYYELALSNDPQNAAARQGLVAVASKLVLQARAQIDNGDFPAADILLADARRLDPSSGELADATAALTTARNRIEQERIAAEQRAVEQAAAEKAAAEVAAAEKVAAERAAAERAEAERQAAAEQAAALNTNAAGGDTDAAVNEPPVATAPIYESPVPVSQLNRIRYVAPKYPRSAQRRNLQGYVDVIFTVAIDGTVKDVEARNSEPGETFVRSATSAVADWEFEPVMENGIPVEKRAAVRMMFALE